MNTATIIGFVLFAVSEIAALLPIPASGILDSMIQGFQNSFVKKLQSDIEMDRSLIDKKPELATFINKLTMNKNINIHEADLFSDIEKLYTIKDFKLIFDCIKNDPNLIEKIKPLVN